MINTYSKTNNIIIFKRKISTQFYFNYFYYRFVYFYFKIKKFKKII